MKRNYLFALLSFCLLWNCGLSANAIAGDLAEGIEKYRGGHYAEALASINCAKYDVGRAAEAHYYKGCCLAKLNRNGEAVSEFKLARLLDKSGKVAPLAAQALKGYGESTVTDRAISAAAPSPGSAKSSIEPPNLKDCAKKITSQAEERINRAWTDQRSVTSGRQSPGPGFPPFPFPGFQAPPPPAIPGFDRNRYKFYQYPTAGRNNPYYNSPEYSYQRQRAKGVADSAEGLVSLLTRHDDGKGVYLVPQGTNLYVRNYEFGSSIDPVILPMKTDMKMLSAKRFAPGSAPVSIPVSAQAPINAPVSDASIAPCAPALDNASVPPFAEPPSSPSANSTGPAVSSRAPSVATTEEDDEADVQAAPRVVPGADTNSAHVVGNRSTEKHAESTAHAPVLPAIPSSVSGGRTAPEHQATNGTP